MRKWLKSKFCTHYYGYFKDTQTPMYFMRPKRLVMTVDSYRIADLDFGAVKCQGCGYRFFETSKLPFGYSSVQSALTIDDWYIGKPL